MCVCTILLEHVLVLLLKVVLDLILLFDFVLLLELVLEFMLVLLLLEHSCPPPGDYVGARPHP